MSLLCRTHRSVCLLAAMAGAHAASAQSTDGYHAIQVLPVVVDTASFTQRIYLHNPGLSPSLHITPTYYPATVSGQPNPVVCPDVVVPARTLATVLSLRQLCPGLAPGSTFGMMLFTAGNSRTFSVYSRVSNAAGAGFSVEGFAAKDFGTIESHVSGLRRSASTLSAPAYQTNCFMGHLGRLDNSGNPIVLHAHLHLHQDGVPIGDVSVSLLPGEVVRLLDVFAAAGSPAGDYDHAEASFSTEEVGGGLVSFCTVQDNTSFGADFRIGKQIQSQDVGGEENRESQRFSGWSGMLQLDGLSKFSRAFAIPPGSSTNTHLYYFRNPDYLSCRLGSVGSGAALDVDYGLEMRLVSDLVNSDEAIVIAGGNDTTGFSDVYLADRQGRPWNRPYYLQVESNGRNEAANRPYAIFCGSGSGGTAGEVIQSGTPATF